MAKAEFRKFSVDEQKSLAVWATACAARVLPYFEDSHPDDDRPRQALSACHDWVRTGKFSMGVIRAASLGAHAAAREAGEGTPALLAARAAGQAAGTPHVTQHAYGAALYALKAILAANPEEGERHAIAEREWQAAQLPAALREDIMSRITLVRRGGKIAVKLDKSPGF